MKYFAAAGGCPETKGSGPDPLVVPPAPASRVPPALLPIEPPLPPVAPAELLLELVPPVLCEPPRELEAPPLPPVRESPELVVPAEDPLDATELPATPPELAELPAAPAELTVPPLERPPLDEVPEPPLLLAPALPPWLALLPLPPVALDPPKDDTADDFPPEAVEPEPVPDDEHAPRSGAKRKVAKTSDLELMGR